MSVNFTVEDIEKALELNDDGEIRAVFLVPKDEYNGESWAQRLTSKSLTKKGDNGLPLIGRVETLSGGAAETFAYEFNSEFFHEGGYLPDLGYFEAKYTWCLGDGKEMGVVLFHEESGRWFRKTGYHSSWDVGEFDGPLEEVFPTEVTVTRFVPSSRPHVAYEYPSITKK